MINKGWFERDWFREGGYVPGFCFHMVEFTLQLVDVKRRVWMEKEMVTMIVVGMN
tara:strand:+ start:840 stop:1004 length:165 start_codon:yes stop_codon:yes gene_type:complete